MKSNIDAYLPPEERGKSEPEIERTPAELEAALERFSYDVLKGWTSKPTSKIGAMLRNKKRKF